MKANGRINLLDAPNPMELYDREVIRAPKSFHCALQGNWENSPLSDAFFSAANQQIVQNGVRAGVYRLSNNEYVIAPQPYTELQIVMRSIFLQQSKNLPGNLTAQIEELNRAVINYIAPRAYGEAKGYLNFLRDASTLAVPIAAPVSTVSYDKTLELKPFF
jgi:hypothetical protein